VLGQIGTKLGVDSATAEKAAAIGVPLITGGMAKAASAPGGAASMMDMLGKLDPNMLNDVVGSLSGMPAGSGKSMVDSLFGSALGPLTAQIKASTGIDVGPFLPMLTPIVAGVVAKFAKTNNLDAAGLTNTLQSEVKAFADSGNPVAGVISNSLKQIGTPITDAAAPIGAAVGTAAAATGAAVGGAAAAAGSAATQAGQIVTGAASSAGAAASSAARDVTAATTTPGRPMGVTILGVLALISGIIGLCGGISLFGLFGLGAAAGVATGDAGAAVGLGAISGLLGLGSVLSGVLSLIGAFGLLTLKNWGRLLVMIGAIIGIISAVLSLIGALTGGGDFLTGLLGLIINGVILWYLNRPDVKAAFGR
jgi:hypothetical protein